MIDSATGEKDAFSSIQFPELDDETTKRVQASHQRQIDQKLGIANVEDESLKQLVRDEYALQQEGYAVFTDSVEFTLDKKYRFSPERNKQHVFWYFQNLSKDTVEIFPQGKKRRSPFTESIGNEQLLFQNGDVIKVGNIELKCLIHEAYLTVGRKEHKNAKEL